MDMDNSGSVDFLDFCAFMGKSHSEYQAAHIDRGSIMERSAHRIRVADTAARRVSAVADGEVAAIVELVVEDEVVDDEGEDGKAADN
jgi:hypothetical protein